MVPKTSNRRILSTLDILATAKSHGFHGLGVIMTLGQRREADSDVSGSNGKKGRHPGGERFHG